MRRWMVMVGLLFTACGGEATTTLLAPPATTVRDGGPIVQPPRDAGVRDAGFIRDAGFVRDAGVRDSGPPPVDLDAWLGLNDRVIVDAVTEPGDGTKLYALRFFQPEDHQRPDGRGFWQRLVLRYQGAERPMVVHTTGYDLFGEPFDWAGRWSEPVSMFRTNELIVEHRFFGSSIVPEDPDWSKLTIAQSADDTHEIFESFREFFQANWAGTGVSKGGMTAIFHHYRHPNDYDGILPYVAPISFGRQDTRYLMYLDGVGPADGACRTRVRDLAAAFIVRRDELVTEAVRFSPELGMLPPALVAAAIARRGLSFEWGFWQGQGDPAGCASLPDPNGPTRPFGLYVYIDAMSLTNPMASSVEPYYFQVQNELGGPTQRRPEIVALAQDVDFSSLPSAPPPPWWPNQQPVFDSTVMPDVDDWLRNDARDVVGIYGAWDPWSGGMPTVSSQNNAFVYVVDEIGHAAQANMLDFGTREEVFDRMSAILGVPPSPSGNDVGTPSVRERHQAVVDAVVNATRARSSRAHRR